jgi:hypothetical protein
MHSLGNLFFQLTVTLQAACFIVLNVCSSSHFQRQFHSTIGIKMIDQSPKNYISKEIFDKVSNYVIPKVQLINRCFISISLNDLKILGFPTRIDNKIYTRNAFLFNLCFVFDNDSRTTCFESIIRKCTEYLVCNKQLIILLFYK